MKDLDEIIAAFSKLEYNEGCYQSYEDAIKDTGKLTFDEASAMFRKATGYSISLIKETFDYVVPNPEWHYNSLLIEQCNCSIRQVFFLNSSEIVDIASNWHDYTEIANRILRILRQEKKIARKMKKEKAQAKQKFLTTYATRIERVIIRPKLFLQTNLEVYRENKWFSCYRKNGWYSYPNRNYNITIYYSGWIFSSYKRYNEFLKHYRF